MQVPSGAAATIWAATALRVEVVQSADGVEGLTGETGFDAELLLAETESAARASIRPTIQQSGLPSEAEYNGATTVGRVEPTQATMSLVAATDEQPLSPQTITDRQEAILRQVEHSAPQEPARGTVSPIIGSGFVTIPANMTVPSPQNPERDGTLRVNAWQPSDPSRPLNNKVPKPHVLERPAGEWVREEPETDPAPVPVADMTDAAGRALQAANLRDSAHSRTTQDMAAQRHSDAGQTPSPEIAPVPNRVENDAFSDTASELRAPHQIAQALDVRHEPVRTRTFPLHPKDMTFAAPKAEQTVQMLPTPVALTQVEHDQATPPTPRLSADVPQTSQQIQVHQWTPGRPAIPQASVQVVETPLKTVPEQKAPLRLASREPVMERAAPAASPQLNAVEPEWQDQAASPQPNSHPETLAEFRSRDNAANAARSSDGSILSPKRRELLAQPMPPTGEEGSKIPDAAARTTTVATNTPVRVAEGVAISVPAQAPQAVNPASSDGLWIEKGVPVLGDQPFMPSASTLPQTSPLTTPYVQNTDLRPAYSQILATIQQSTSAEGQPRTEVLLSPEELGRVRIHISGPEDNLQVRVFVERPETLELMRRQVDLLAQELRQSGLSNANLSFGDWRQHDQKSDNRTATGKSQGFVISAAESAPSTSARTAEVGRLHLRL